MTSLQVHSHAYWLLLAHMQIFVATSILRLLYGYSYMHAFPY